MEDKIIIDKKISKIDIISTLIISNKNILILGIIPIILLLIDNSWIFPNPFSGYADDWLYTGYFLNFQSFHSVFGNLYFVSRLPWIIPGYLIYNLFPVSISVYVLHLFFYYCSIISLYLILKNTVSEHAGFISALLFSFYPFFMREIGANYVFGAVIAYLLLAFLMITKSYNSKNQFLLLFFAGIFSTLLLFTNLFTILLLPIIGLYYIIVYSNCLRKEFIPSGVALALGALFVFDLMCIFNQILTGDFDFYSPQIRASFYYTTWTNEWWHPWSEWILNAPWLILPAIGVVISIIYAIFIIHSSEKRNIVHLFFILSYLILFFIFLALELYGKPVLEIVYYASILIPLLFLALGPFFHRIFEKFTNKNGVYFSYSCIGILLFGYILETKSVNIAYFINNIILVIITFFIIAILTLFYFFNRVISQKKFMALGIFVICLFSILYIGNFSVVFPKGFDTYENGYYAIMDSALQIKETFPHSDVKFWYNTSESDKGVSYGNFFTLANSVYLWGWSKYSSEFPLLPFSDGANNVSFTNHYQNIAVLSTDDNAFELVNLSFSNYDKKPIFISRHVIHHNKIRYNLILLKLPEKKIS